MVVKLAAGVSILWRDTSAGNAYSSVFSRAKYRQLRPMVGLAPMRKTCDPDKNVAPLCAGRNRGSDSPGNEDGATIESVQRPHRSSSASKIAGTQVTLRRAIFTGGVCSVSQGDVRSRLRDKGRFGARSEQFPSSRMQWVLGGARLPGVHTKAAKKKMRLQPLR